MPRGKAGPCSVLAPSGGGRAASAQLDDLRGSGRVIWLLILVPAVARHRQEVARPSEAALVRAGARPAARRPDPEVDDSGRTRRVDRTGRRRPRTSDAHVPTTATVRRPADDHHDEPHPDDRTMGARPPPRYRPGRGGYDPQAAAVAARSPLRVPPAGRADPAVTRRDRHAAWSPPSPCPRVVGARRRRPRARRVPRLPATTGPHGGGDPRPPRRPHGRHPPPARRRRPRRLGPPPGPPRPDADEPGHARQTGAEPAPPDRRDCEDDADTSDDLLHDETRTRHRHRRADPRPRASPQPTNWPTSRPARASTPAPPPPLPAGTVARRRRLEDDPDLHDLDGPARARLPACGRGVTPANVVPSGSGRAPGLWRSW